MKLLLLLLTAVLFQSSPQEQEDNRVVFDKMVHDFGDFTIQDGPKTHTFVFTNKWDKPVIIQSVISSCGCAAPDWTREPVNPGATGNITVTFNNNLGPYPFEKSLSVYLAGFPRPYVLRIRGVVHPKKVSVEQTHPVVMGPVRLRKKDLELGQIRQGMGKTDSVEIINTGKKPVFLKATSDHPNLTIQIPFGRLDPGEKGLIYYNVDTRKQKIWGDATFHARLIINGKEDPRHVLTVKAAIKMNPDELSQAEKAKAPIPQMNKSAVDFSVVAAGSAITENFILFNKGKTPLIIYAIDTSHPEIEVTMNRQVAPGAETPIRVVIPGQATKEPDEVIYTISLTTNAPSRPTVNLLVYGHIK